MEKILISTNQDKVRKSIEQIDSFIQTSNELNIYLQDNLNTILTQDIALDIIANGGTKLLDKYKKDQGKMLDKSGISGRIKSNLMSTIDADLKKGLTSLKAKFYDAGMDPMTALEHVEFDATGQAIVNSTHYEHIVEQASTYVETANQLALYNAQVAAVEALNNLRNTTRKVLPSTFFISPMEYYTTFFEWDSMSEKIIQKPLNYSVV